MMSKSSEHDGEFEDSASVRTDHEEIDTNKVGNEKNKEDFGYYQRLSKFHVLSIEETMKHKRCVKRNDDTFVRIIQKTDGRIFPTSDGNIHDKCAQTIQEDFMSPNRQNNSTELITIERLGRLLKIRRMRQSSYDRRLLCCQEHSHNPHEKGARVRIDCSVLQKEFFRNDMVEYKVPEALFVPSVDGDSLSDPGLVHNSKFSLMPRLKRKTVLSHRPNLRWLS